MTVDAADATQDGTLAPTRTDSGAPGTVRVEDVLASGRYRLGKLLGSGGGGAVYLVYDGADGDAPRALKILGRPRDPAALERFRREFALQKEIRHPGIVPVHDFGVTVSGAYYFTMDFVQGRDLREAALALPVKERLDLLVMLGEALDFLHARKLVHLDLKPRNVLVEEERRRVRLLDFGLTERRDRPAETGEVRGTLAYMSPEMILGRALTPAADLYAFGVIAFELLTGNLPFQAKDATELLRCHLEEAPPRPSAVDPSLPARLDEVVARLLEKDPALRYGRVAQAVHDLCWAFHVPHRETELWATDGAVSRTLVGRAQELDALLDALARAVTDGRPSVAVVEGPAGVGKSRLLEELEVRAQLLGVRAARVTARGSPWDSLVGAACAVVDPAILRQAREGRLAPPDDPLARMGARFLPDLLAESDPERSRVETEAATGAARAAAVAFLLAAGASGRPVLLILERRQEPGRELAAALLSLVRSLSSAVLVVVEAGSDGAFGDVLSRWDPPARRIALPPMTDAQTQEMLVNLLGDAPELPAIASWVVGQSGGLPALVAPIVRQLVASGQLARRQGRWHLLERTLEAGDGRGDHVLAAWVRDLPSDVARWLSAAAVLGLEASETEVAELTGGAPSHAAAAVALGIVTPVSPGRYRFCAEVVRQSLVAALSAPEAADLHGAAAALLARSPAASPEALALHLSRSRRPEAAFEPALLASAKLQRRGAHRQALQMACLARDVASAGTSVEELASLHERIGILHQKLGEREQALQSLDRARGLRQGKDGEIVSRIVRIHLDAGNLETAAAIVDEAVDRLAPEDRSRRAKLEILRAQGHLAAGKNEEARGLLERIVGDLGDDGSLRCQALNMLGQVHQHLGNLSRSLLYFQAALALVDSGRHPRNAAAILLNIGNDYNLMGDGSRVLDVYREAARRAEEAGDPALLAQVSANAGTLDSPGVTLGDRVRDLERALLIFERLGRTADSTALCVLLADVLRTVGDLAPAEALLARAAADADRHGLHATRAQALLCRAQIALERGGSEASDLLASAEQSLSAVGQLEAMAAEIHLARGAFARGQGDHAEAERRARQASAAALAQDLPLAAARADLLLAQTLAGRDDREAMDRLHDAERRLEELGAGIARIEALLVRGEVLMKAERFAQAADALHRAEAMARATGARALAKASHDALERALDMAELEAMKSSGSLGAVAALEQVLRRARRRGDREAAWVSLHRLAERYRRVGAYHKGHELLGEALRELKACVAGLPDDGRRQRYLTRPMAKELFDDIARLERVRG